MAHRITTRRFGVLVLAAALALGATACGGDDDDADVPAGPTGTQALDGGPGGQHTGSDDEEVEYDSTPPPGGLHSPAWQNCGVYREPVRDENVVHSMEHGAVWIAYAPDLAEDQIATLEGKAEGQTHVLVAPYEGLSDPIVLTAWGRQLALDSADDERIDEFLDDFVQGPQAPEQGGSCSGAIGQPVDA